MPRTCLTAITSFYEPKCSKRAHRGNRLGVAACSAVCRGPGQGWDWWLGMMRDASSCVICGRPLKQPLASCRKAPHDRHELGASLCDADQHRWHRLSAGLGHHALVAVLR